MSLKIKITDVHARQILDSRGNPTVEVEVTAETETTGKKITARESVPSGAEDRGSCKHKNPGNAAWDECVRAGKIRPHNGGT